MAPETTLPSEHPLGKIGVIPSQQRTIMEKSF
jgi:hypothetical protein